MAYVSLFAATMKNGDVRIMNVDQVAAAQREGLVDEVVHQEVDVPIEIGLVQEGGATKILIEGATALDRAVDLGDGQPSLSIEDAAGRVDRKVGRPALPNAYDPWDSTGNGYFVEVPARTLEEFLGRVGNQIDRQCLYITPDAGQFWLSGDGTTGAQPYATLNSAKRAGNRLLAEAEESFEADSLLDRFGLSAEGFMCSIEEDSVSIHRRDGSDYLFVMNMDKVEYIDDRRSIVQLLHRPVADVVEEFARGPLVAATPRPGA